MKHLLSYLPILRKYEIIIAGIIVFLVVIILSITFLIPNFTKAQMIYSQRRQLEKQFVALKTKDKTLSSFDFQFYKENMPKLNQVLPFSKDYISLFNTLDSLQIKTGATILRTDLQFGVISTSGANLSKNSGNNPTPLSIVLEMMGNLSSMKSFLESLNDLSGRILTIDEIQLTFKEDESLQARMTGKAYYYLPPASIGSITTPLPVLNSSIEEYLKKIANNPPPPSLEDEIKDIVIGKRNLFN